MARRRTWSPPRQSAHTFSPSPSMAQVAPRPEVVDALVWAWKHDPAGHLAANKPRCTVTGCRELAMLWARCKKGCRAVIARCHIHDSTNPMRAARLAHEVACAS